MDMEKCDKNVQKTDSKVGTSLSLDSDTSISDFKSPKIKPIEKLKLFDFKLTTKKKNTCKKTDLNKGLNKKTNNQLKKNIFDVHTRTESNTSVEKSEKSEKSESVKLSNDTKVAYVCPLCLKNFKDSNSRILHMKNCAAKNNVSMEKLLQAMELQERQSAERVSLGLLAAPVLQNKKQTTINKMFLAKDHQLQLALALSKSLYEAEEVGNCSEIEDLADICLTKDSTKELTDKNLMGNITSRLQKRKKPTFITVLQTRSKEERDRLITEKIAEILIDSGTLDQSQQQTQSKFKNIKRNNLRSHILKKYLNLDNKLWNSAMLQSNQEDFYVLNLSPYIIPSTKQMFMESENDSNISNKSEQKDSLPTESNLHLNEKESSNIPQKVDIKLFPNAEKEDINIQPSINTLILDWGNALNNSSSSDIIIFVNGGKHIWVHKLIFYVRCSNILLDIIPNNNTAYSVKEMICWTDVEYLIALAFLEFLYCGIIKKHAISFNDNIAISSLGHLARRYKVKELFTYLRPKYSRKDKFELYKQDTQEICNKNDKQNEFVEHNMLTSKKDINDVNCSNHSMPDISIMEIPHDKQLKTNMTSSEKCVALVDRENNISPDIFNDTNDVKLNHTNMEHLNKNLDILLSPIQCNSKNITNRILFSSTINKSRSPIDECILNESLMTTSKSNPDMADRIKPKSNLTLFIEEVQRENAKSDFASDSEIDSLTKSFIQYNKNPFRKKDYDESSILNKLHNSKLSPDQPEKKQNCLSKLENDMQIHANENPQLYNITIDKNLTKPIEPNHTDLLSSIREIKTSCLYNDKNFSEKTIPNSQANNVSRTASSCSDSEMNIDDLDMYTKNKRKYTDNNIVVYRSASKKYKNSMTEIKNDEMENNKAIASNSGKVEDEIEIYDTLLNNSFQHIDNFKEQDINNCSNDSLKTQISSNENFNNDYSNIFNLVSPEISDIENQDDNPLKLSTNPDSIVISSSSDIDINSQDINNFNKNDNFSVPHSKIQESDDELHYTFPNEIHFSNINIDNRTEHISLHNKALHVSSKNKRSRKRCKSEGNLQINYTTEENDKFDKFNNMNSLQSNKEDNHKFIIKNRLFTITENNDISPPNYDVMDTAELYREMQKYGLKVQNRNKTIKLLTYIYNELHPTIDSYETIDTSAKNMYNEYEEPQKKRLKVDINLSDKYSNIERECNISPFKNWNSNNYPVRMETAAEYSNNVENLVALSDCDSIKEAFSKLIKFNKDLHNKILQYEPLNIELLHHMLKTNGFKCKINTLIDFLDDQCITFYFPENKTKTRSRK